MKEVKAVIQPHKLEKIREALTALPGFPGMTVTRVEGCSAAQAKEGHALNVREELTDFSHKIKLEILAPDDLAETLVTLIHELAHTGHLGDGIVWVTPAEHFVRIRQPLPG